MSNQPNQVPGLGSAGGQPETITVPLSVFTSHGFPPRPSFRGDYEDRGRGYEERRGYGGRFSPQLQDQEYDGRDHDDRGMTRGGRSSRPYSNSRTRCQKCWLNKGVNIFNHPEQVCILNEVIELRTATTKSSEELKAEMASAKTEIEVIKTAINEIQEGVMAAHDSVKRMDYKINGGKRTRVDDDDDTDDGVVAFGLNVPGSAPPARKNGKQATPTKANKKK